MIPGVTKKYVPAADHIIQADDQDSNQPHFAEQVMLAIQPHLKTTVT